MALNFFCYLVGCPVQCLECLVLTVYKTISSFSTSSLHIKSYHFAEIALHIVQVSLYLLQHHK